MKLPRATRLFVKVNGEAHYLWRAVDHEGEVLESYVTMKRDKSAALAFLKKALKRHGRAETIVTDGMRSYPAVMRELGNLERREMGRRLNNRVENSLQSTPPFTTTSVRTAISLIARPTSFVAPAPWQSGKTSWPERALR